MMLFPKTCPLCQQTLSYDGNYANCLKCLAYSKRLKIYQRALLWADGRAWWWRLPIAVVFVVILIGVLRNAGSAMDRYRNPLSAFDLGIHELGHVIFSPFGELMHIAGGSLFQCIFPLLWMIGCIQKQWYFAASLCWCWLGYNLFDVAVYAADARAGLLPLATGLGALGSDAADSETTYLQAHDWYQLLSRTGHLSDDLAIAQGLRIAGTICFLIGLALASSLLFRMMRSSLQKQAR